MKKFNTIVILLLAVATLSGCVYYNTFYNAKKAFDEAESKRKESARSKGAGPAANLYKRAIEKSDKVLENHQTSKWYDDALYVNGVSHFYLENYARADRRFRELLAEFPKFNKIREVRIYQAKTKLALGNEAEAMTIFEKLFSESMEKSVKADAALALGEYYYENKNYDQAREYFSSLVDSLGDEDKRLISQQYIADSYFARFKYKQAMENYLKILELSPTTEEEYLAMYRAGECSYFLNNISEGMDFYYKLADDPRYYDSLGQVKLQIALGHELDGDLVLAEDVYREIALENPEKASGAAANYNLGLIYQFDYEDYKKAKEFYDKAKNRKADEDIYKDALQRSTDIGKLEQFLKRDDLDTSSTRADIDSAAATQYLLGELYFFQLDKPDSAYQEFAYILNNFPESYFAPKALLAMAMLERDFYSDTAAYDSTLRVILSKYPHSDYIPEVIAQLGLAGTIADTGYAEYYYNRAEDFLFDKDNIDSARYYFNYVADSFPNSKINVKAKFASIWAKEEYASPGDSSLYFAYVDLVDSFPGTEYGAEADRKLLLQEGKGVKPVDRAFDEDEPVYGDVVQPASDSASTTSSSTALLTSDEKLYTDPEGKSIREVDEDPIRVENEFIYPTAAYFINEDIILYFQIKINAFGGVDDYRLMNPSKSPELNKAAEETVKLTYFDTGWMLPEEFGTWFVYKFRAVRPTGLR